MNEYKLIINNFWLDLTQKYPKPETDEYNSIFYFKLTEGSSKLSKVKWGGLLANICKTTNTFYYQCHSKNKKPFCIYPVALLELAFEKIEGNVIMKDYYKIKVQWNNSKEKTEVDKLGRKYEFEGTE